ncbi:uncharacterized protein LOC110646521 [Hevea brasiliensis]|uniref:uncharacterized protein LOC110646521 n=1 Tax=Hevea brasiliensis TaxID=3981 RepID=UPI0025DFC55F|nr:uncharacterized protein LOC110646521 [Hevea brasiliensis]
MEVPYRRTRDGVSEIFRRELGLSHSRSFTRRFSASEVVVKQIDLYGELIGHEGSVNAVEFNSTGDLLVSGSDDTDVIFWDWATKSRKFSFFSGHSGEIFQTRIMPFTDDRRIVTSSADGQVRLVQVLDNGQVDTARLGKHQGPVHSLAVDPGSPHIIYSCGDDGFVQHFDVRSWSATKLFCCSSLTENSKRPPNSIKLNAIVINPRNPNYFAVGGSDVFARVYDIRKCRSDAPVNTFCPRHLIKSKNVEITGLAYSNTSELLVSYSDELIYLFQKNMGMEPYPFSTSPQDLQKLEEPQVYLGHRNAIKGKGVSFFGPNDEYVLSGSDCGNIFIWKKRGGKLLRLMFGDRQFVCQLEPHPHMPIFATGGIEKNVKLWVPMASEAPPLPENVEKIMESNRQGREEHSDVALTPEVIMLFLLQKRQTLAYRDRYTVESDEDEGEA